MSNPILWCRNAWGLKEQAAANLAVGRAPAAHGILVQIGMQQFNGDKLKADLDAAKEASKPPNPPIAPVLWVSPPNKELDAGAIDVPGLPSHPSVAALVDILQSRSEPIVVRLLYECANHTGPNNPGLRYVSPATFRAAFEGIARRLPVNCIVAWSYGPNGWAYDPNEWMPDPSLWRLADCSQFGRKHRSLSDKAGKNAAAHYAAAAAADNALKRETLRIVGESGHATKDYTEKLPDGTVVPRKPTPEEVRDDIKGLLGFCAENDVRLLGGPFNSSDMGCVMWADVPMAAAVMAKAASKGTLLSLPLPAPTAMSPLVASGLVQP